MSVRRDAVAHRATALRLAVALSVPSLLCAGPAVLAACAASVAPGPVPGAATGSAVGSAVGAATGTPSSAPPVALVASAAWTTRSGVRSLRVVPTQAGRSPGVDDATVWAQVVALRPDADTPGMRDQLICHVRFAPGKAAWYLEPARPAVGYAATVAAACNPGSVPDGG